MKIATDIRQYTELDPEAVRDKLILIVEYSILHPRDKEKLIAFLQEVSHDKMLNAVMVTMLVQYQALWEQHKNLEQKNHEKELLAEQIRQKCELRRKRHSTEMLKNKLIANIEAARIEGWLKEIYMERLQNLPSDYLEKITAESEKTTTAMDLKYLLCFAMEMEVKDIAAVFSIEPESVYSAHYRLKQKYKIL